MDPMIFNVVLPATGFLLIMLLSGNLFFIKRLVEKLDKNCDEVQKLKTQFAVLAARLTPAGVSRFLEEKNV